MTIYGMLDESAFKPYIHNNYSHTINLHVLIFVHRKITLLINPIIHTDCNDILHLTELIVYFFRFLHQPEVESYSP